MNSVRWSSCTWRIIKGKLCSEQDYQLPKLLFKANKQSKRSKRQKGFAVSSSDDADDTPPEATYVHNVRNLRQGGTSGRPNEDRRPISSLTRSRNKAEN